MALTVELTSEEADKVARFAKDPRPRRFDAATNTDVTITEDFEAYLILQQQSLLDEAVRWISNLKSLNIVRQDRDLLLAEALENELEDARAGQEEINQRLAQFNAFRAQFQPAQFAGVTEVGQFLSDMQFALGEINTQQARLNHDVVAAVIGTARFEADLINEARTEQITSWANVLTAYRDS